MKENNDLGILIPIKENNGQKAVNARDLHAFLESKQQFADWIKGESVDMILRKEKILKYFALTIKVTY